MQNLNPNLNSEVLTRVQFIYQLRRLSSPIVVKSVGLLALLSATALQVSVLNVIANSPSPTNLEAMYSFAYSAFSNTSWLVRFTIFGLMFVLGWLVGDAWRNIKVSRFAPTLPRLPLNLFRF